MKAIAGTIMQIDDNASGISVAVQQQDAVSREISQSAMPRRTKRAKCRQALPRFSDAAVKTGQVANAVLNAGSQLADRSNRPRSEVERFLAEVRVA